MLSSIFKNNIPSKYNICDFKYNNKSYNIHNQLSDYIYKHTESKRICTALTNEEKNIMKELKGIIGIGDALALKLIKLYNVRSIEHLKYLYISNKIKLSNITIIGLKYYYELHEKFMIDEARQIVSKIDKVIKEIDQNYITFLTGSFCREIPSREIIILISNPSILLDNDIEYQLCDIINLLQKKEIIIESITKNIIKRFDGICRLNNKNRKILLKMVNFNSISFSNLYHNGPKDFFQKMKYIAKKNNYVLTEYGIYKNIKNINNKVSNLNTEKLIFNFLNLQYIHPKHRNSIENINTISNNL